MFSSLIVNLYGSRMNDLHKELVTKYHYLKTWRSLKEQYVFELLDDGQIVGLAIFGQPCGSSVIKKYGEGTIELRRFYCLDYLQKNTETWFLSRCLRQLKQTDSSRVISYSDPNQNHVGTIYKAANFIYLGKELNNPRLMIYKGKRVSIRQIYQKNDYGGYDKKALFYQDLIKSGKAKLKKQKKKDIFIYDLKRKVV